MADAMVAGMTDADVWRLALAIEALNAAASDAGAAGVDQRFVRNLVALATRPAHEVLDIAIHLADPEDLQREHPKRNTP